MEGGFSKITSTGRSPRSETPSIEKVWKIDRPKIYWNIPKDWGFPLIIREIIFPTWQFQRNPFRPAYWFQTIINGNTLKTGLPLIWEDKTCRHFKWRDREQVGIVDKWLFLNKGSGRSVNEANDENDPPGCPYSAKIAPTNLRCGLTFNLDDYGKKESTTQS